MTRHTPHATRRTALVGTALATAAILVATLHPAGNSLPRGWSFTLASGNAALAEIIQNLLLFLPLGAALALGGMRTTRAALVGMLLSFSVEFAQQWIRGRDPSAGDILCNTISTAIGALLVHTAPRWLTVSPRRAAWQSLATALTAAAVWLATGWLLRPIPQPPPYTVVPTPSWNYWGRYGGRVLSASTGGTEGVTVTAVASQKRPGRASPLVAVVTADAHKSVAHLVLIDRADLSLLYHTRAAALTLEQPDLRWYQALAAVAPGDTFTVTASRQRGGEHAGACLIVNGAGRCNLGYTLGDGWKLVFFPAHFPTWAMRLLNALWAGGTLLGVGYWAGRRPATGVAVAVVIVALLVGPTLVGLRPTPNGEIVGALGGLWLGWGLRRLGGGRYDGHRTPQSAFTVRH